MIETDGKCCVHGAGHYEENLRVPLLLKLPGGSDARTTDVIARHIDLFPTVLDVAGLENDYDGAGESLLEDERPSVVSYSEADGRCAMRRAIVTDRYKYIYTAKGAAQTLLQSNAMFFDDTCAELCREVPAEELYDLLKDPFEKTNLLRDQSRADELETLRREMATHLNLPVRYIESIVTGPSEGLDDEKHQELRDALETLGYIN